MLKDLRIRTKLMGSYIVIAGIAAVIGLISIVKLRQMHEADTVMYQRVAVPLRQLAEMSVSFQRVRINVRDAIEEKDPAKVQAVWATIAELRKNIRAEQDKFEKTIITQEGKNLLEEFKKARATYGQYLDKVKELDDAHQDKEALSLVHGEAKTAALHEQECLNKLMASKELQGKLKSEENLSIADTAQLTMLFLVVLGVLVAVGFGYVITRMITTPLARAVSVADRLADGDLTAEIEVTSRDEMGKLMEAMKNMVASLKGLISNTVEISANIAAASNQLHSTSEQIATGAEEVASQAATVATSSEEMSATSSDIARNCGMAADASKHSTRAAESGATVVKEIVAGMNVIAQRVRETSHTVEALGSRSEQIGNIIGTIEDIADQTNLLALNAAIEAARAGEQGRGFAVVADEVRALAERTTKATKEIGAMITAIQNETKAAVRAMEDGVQEVEKGAVSSQRSGEALEEIMSRINEVSMQINQIATAAEEQTATTGEVTSNIQQITDVVTQTARGAEETAGAAAQLASQANDLQNLVRRFRLA